MKTRRFALPAARLFLVALAIAAGCAKSPAAPSAPPAARVPPNVLAPAAAPPTLQVTRFMAFGDSLTEGEVQPNIVPTAIEIEHAYPTVLLELLQARYKAQTFTVANEGIGGHRAAEDNVSGRFLDALTDNQPEVVLLLQGIVDLYQQQNEMGIEAVAHALRDDIRNAVKRNAHVFLSTLPPQKVTAKNYVDSDVLEEANDAIRHLGDTEPGVTIVDGYAAISVDVANYVGGDGLHLTVAGYQALATAFFNAIAARYEVAPPPPPRWSSGPSIPAVGSDVEVRPKGTR